MRYMKLQHELIHTRFDEAKGKWHLKLRRPVSDSTSTDAQYEVIEDTADFVLSCVGALSRWDWPDIQGLHDFKGKVLHSAGWETDGGKTWEEGLKDWGAKNVGVIGVVSFFPVRIFIFSDTQYMVGILGTSTSPSFKDACQSCL